MKKRLFLLPLLAGFALSGCSIEDLMFWKKSGGNEQQQKEDSKKEDDTPSVVPSGEGETAKDCAPPRPTAPGEVIVEMSAYDLSDLANKGYSACAGDHDFDGFTMNLNGGVQVNKDVGNFKKNTLHVFQFAKTGHDKFPAGELTVKDVQPSKVIVQAFVKSTFKWGSNQLGTVKFGEETITVPGESTKSSTEYSADYAIHTVTLDVGANSAGDFSILNSNTFAIYIAFIGFYA